MENNNSSGAKDVMPAKRPRGRPRGSKNKEKEPGFHRYNPQRWQPWMDSLVLASIAGASNKELAEGYEITETHVSNLLCTEMASKIKLKVRHAVLEKSNDLSDKLSQIRDLAATRMLSALKDDQLAIASPISMAQLAKELFKVSAPPEAEKEKPSVTNIQTQQNILVANPLFVQRIDKGLELSNEIQARRLEQGKEALRLVANDK